jgi:hypothetical protein
MPNDHVRDAEQALDNAGNSYIHGYDTQLVEATRAVGFALLALVQEVRRLDLAGEEAQV